MSKAVIFDFDGVIAETEPFQLEAYNRLLSDELLEQQFEKFLLLTPKNDQQLKIYVERRYRPTYDVSFSFIEAERYKKQKGLAHSIFKGLEYGIETSDVLIVLGHTIFKQELIFLEDWIIFSDVSEEVPRWCYVELDKKDYVIKFIDKPKERLLPDKALIGLYYFKDKNLLFECLKATIKNQKTIHNKYQLSTALIEYNKVKKIKGIPAEIWYDCGNITGLHRTRRKLISARSFNNISVDEDVGVLTKKSSHTSDLHQEFSWYVSLPRELMGLVPRVIDYKPCCSNDGQAELSLEYYGYHSLEEAWVYQNLQTDIWLSILNHILIISKKFREYKARLSQEDFKLMYIYKTKNRLDKLQKTQSEIQWNILLNYIKLTINGKDLQGLPLLKGPIKERAENLYNEDHTTIIHGDFHFANILYDLNCHLIKLIDPRGSFGTSGLFGDCKYDLAKLRHSMSGGYNFIVNDLFNVKIEKNKLDLELPSNSEQQQVIDWFDEQIMNEGFLIEDIKLIEGLLFLSMLPLHADHTNRQLAMFARAVIILNEVFNPNSE